jgi:ABC-2 type transport system permease protein
MSWRRSGAIAGHELRLAAREPGVLLTLLVMPVLMIAFLKPAFAPALAHLVGHPVNGADQAVPGMVAMFSFFSAGFVGFAIFREHGWHTWDRLRASQARPLEIIAGKVTPPVLITLLLDGVLFAIGRAVFGLQVTGSVAGLALISVALTVAFVAIGVLLAAWLKTTQQLQAVQNVLAFVLAGLGGAFSPLGVLPGWARAASPVTPTYWAMEGYQNVILRPGGLLTTIRPTLVLLGFAAAATVAACFRLRFDESKRFN